MKRTTLFSLEVMITDGTMEDAFVARNPVVSRTIEIRADQTLNQLHRAIFDAFDRWDDCHLREFRFGREFRDRSGDRYVLQFIYDDPDDCDLERPPAGSMERTRIGKLNLEPGQVFWYWYDFGDNWQHKIRVLSIGEAEPGVKYPMVTARVGESPPQYLPLPDGIVEAAGYDLSLDEPEDVPQWATEPGAAASGTSRMVDGAEIAWRHEVLTPEAASELRSQAANRTYRVLTVRVFADGTTAAGNYLVPGPWLNACIQELGCSGDEKVLSVEVVQAE